jgi:hypothetical protein
MVKHFKVIATKERVFIWNSFFLYFHGQSSSHGLAYISQKTDLICPNRWPRHQEAPADAKRKWRRAVGFLGGCDDGIRQAAPMQQFRRPGRSSGTGGFD